MSYIPKFVKTSDLTADTLNAIGADIGVDVTVVQDNRETLFEYGKQVLGTTSMQNRFLSTLMNKIVRSELINKAWSNPLKALKKGVLDFGEGVEETFIDIQRGDVENEDLSNPTNPYLANIPNVRTTYHVSNVQRRYSKILRIPEMKKVFYSFSALDDFVNKIIASLNTEAEWDEYLLTKLVVADRVLEAVRNGKDINLLLSTPTEEEYAKGILRKARELAEVLPKIKTQYNIAGVHTHTEQGNIVCFLDAATRATIDVDALAGAFNMDKADFIGRVITLDNFTFTDDEVERLCAITQYTKETFPISADDMVVLEGIGCVIMDADCIRIYDISEPRMSENELNGGDETKPFWYHLDQSFGSSPFCNFVVIDNNALHTIANTLSHCKTDNPTTKANFGSAYRAVITADSGYTLTGATVSVKVGGKNVTATAYKDGSINIPFVDGDVEITVTAVSAG